MPKSTLTVTKLIGFALPGAIAFSLLCSTQIIAQTPSTQVYPSNSVNVESGKDIPREDPPPIRDSRRDIRARCMNQLLGHNSQDPACQPRQMPRNNTSDRPVLICRIPVLKDVFKWKCPQTQPGNTHAR